MMEAFVFVLPLRFFFVLGSAVMILVFVFKLLEFLFGTSWFASVVYLYSCLYTLVGFIAVLWVLPKTHFYYKIYLVLDSQWLQLYLLTFHVFNRQNVVRNNKCCLSSSFHRWKQKLRLRLKLMEYIPLKTLCECLYM